MSKYSNYIPVKLDENVYTFAIPVKPCPSCGTPMLDTDFSGNAIFWEQSKAAGVRRSFDYARVDGKVVCEVCWAKYAREMFECDNCFKSYPNEQIQYEYKNNGAGYLCKTCYETLTAKQWDEAVEKIQMMYQYSD